MNITEITRLAHVLLTEEINNKAIELGYPTGSIGIVSYSGSNTQYALLAQYFAQWEESVWEKAKNILSAANEDVEKLPEITPTSIRALMPEFNYDPESNAAKATLQLNKLLDYYNFSRDEILLNLITNGTITLMEGP